MEKAIVVVLVVLVVLAVAGAVAGVVVVGRSRRRDTAERTISPADRIEASTSPAPEHQRVLPAGDGRPPLERTARGEDDADVAARFRPPGERSAVAEPAEPVIPAVVARRLEATPSTEGATAATDSDRNVDEVIAALIDRVRSSASNDVVAVVSEMVDHDLDSEQMEEVLSHLVARDAARLPARDELTLSNPKVPRRPGRLSAFGDMGEREKRRVIIRVLCLLIARSEEQPAADDDDEGPLSTVELPDPDGLDARDVVASPTARDLWGDPDDAARDALLPARRRRLARQRVASTVSTGAGVPSAGESSSP